MFYSEFDVLAPIIELFSFLKVTLGICNHYTVIKVSTLYQNSSQLDIECESINTKHILQYRRCVEKQFHISNMKYLCLRHSFLR